LETKKLRNMVKPGALRVDRIRWNENKEWKRIAGYKDGLRAEKTNDDKEL
jgi:hypothetical protein